MALAGLVITSILTGNGEYPSDKSFLREVKCWWRPVDCSCRSIPQISGDGAEGREDLNPFVRVVMEERKFIFIEEHDTHSRFRGYKDYLAFNLGRARALSFDTLRPPQAL
ncbi:hypothetical protein V8E53_009194 [Lactarius tabidus]